MMSSTTPERMTVEQVRELLTQMAWHEYDNNDEVTAVVEQAIYAINAIRRTDMQAVIGEDETPYTLGVIQPGLGDRNLLRAKQRTIMQERLK